MSASEMNRPSSLSRARRTRQRNSMTSSAAIVKHAGSKETGSVSSVADWQQKAWEAYDEVEAIRAVTDWLAHGMSRMNIVAARRPKNPGDDPQPIAAPDGSTDPEALSPADRQVVEFTNDIAGGVIGQGQMFGALSVQLTIPGIGYLLVSPRDPSDPDDRELAVWRVLSNEGAKSSGGRIEVQRLRPDGSDGGFSPLGEHELLIKVWKEHPRRPWEPNSPLRALRRPIRILHALDDFIERTADSRLAGNGLFFLSNEVDFEPVSDDDDRSAADRLSDDIEDAMAAARSTPEAGRAPIVVTVPPEAVKAHAFVEFSTKFDDRVESLSDRQLRRLAIGFDAPPEMMLGIGGANHWTAWQITEEAVTMQLEPLAEVVVDALTSGYLRPMLEAAGIDPAEYMIWYDSTDLRTRPDVSAAATTAHGSYAISNAAYLREVGLDPHDAPTRQEIGERLLLTLATSAPAEVLPVLAAAGYFESLGIKAADAPPDFDFEPVDVPAVDSAPTPTAEPELALPERSEPAPEPVPGMNAAALVAALDGVVYRAMERAGQRLRTAVARSRKAAVETVEMNRPDEFHASLSATKYASVDDLLVDAWTRVPELAERHGVDPVATERALDTYTRALIAAGHRHTVERLTEALGLDHADR